MGELFALPFPDLIFRAQNVHRLHFDPCQVQISTLLSIKTGGCPEDCAYCPQSARYHTGVEAEKLMTLDADEFIHRFLIHVLPDRFHRIRQHANDFNNL